MKDREHGEPRGPVFRADPGQLTEAGHAAPGRLRCLVPPRAGQNVVESHKAPPRSIEPAPKVPVHRIMQPRIEAAYRLVGRPREEAGRLRDHVCEVQSQPGSRAHPAGHIALKLSSPVEGRAMSGDDVGPGL